MGFGGLRTCVPLKWFTKFSKWFGAKISISSAAQAASGPQTPGQIRPRFNRFALIEAGRAPTTELIPPSKASSPKTIYLERGSFEMASVAAISPSTIGRS